MRAKASRWPPSSTTAMFTFSFISSAFFFASARIISAPARFNWTRSRVTSCGGFFSSVGAGAHRKAQGEDGCEAAGA